MPTLPGLEGIPDYQRNEGILKNLKTLNNVELSQEVVHPEHPLRPGRAGRPIF